MGRKTIVAGMTVAAATALALPGGTASAAEPYDGFDVEVLCLQPNDTACLAVATEGRIGTRYRQWDSTAGAGYVVADPDDTLISRVQIDKVVLGTQTAAVATSGSRNSGPARYVEQQGPGVLWSRNCATSYHVAVYWSARLTNGQLKTGKVLGPWYKSPACSPTGWSAAPPAGPLMRQKLDALHS
jgi:hypothetical protein